MKNSLNLKKMSFLALLVLSGATIFGMEPAAPVIHSNKRPRSSAEQNANAEQQVAIVYPQTYFNNDIEQAVINLMLNEKGKIWAAYFRVTSKNVVSWWAARKYIQEFEKAKKESNVDGILSADKYKTSPKEDMLVVDKGCAQEDAKALAILKNAGIKVLSCTKHNSHTNAYQQMHHKFMVFFNENNQGKLVITGSWNMTNQAAHHNWENIVIVNDQNTIDRFIIEHDSLQSYSESCL